jgi:hypothetical protein
MSHTGALEPVALLLTAAALIAAPIVTVVHCADRRDAARSAAEVVCMRTLAEGHDLFGGNRELLADFCRRNSAAFLEDTP